MLRNDLIAVIEREAETNTRIAPELADICIFARKNMPPGSGMLTSEIEAACPEASRRRLNRLVDEIDLLNETSGEADRYLLNERTSKRIYGGKMGSAVNDELKRVNDHIGSDSRVRQIAAGVIGVRPGQVGVSLFQGDLFQQRDRLEEIVSAIKASSTVKQGNYGALYWRSVPNVYEATHYTMSI